MGLGLVILASIPAYLAAGVALFLGSGWLMALGILMVTGVVGSLGLAALRVILAAATPRTPSLSLT